MTTDRTLSNELTIAYCTIKIDGTALSSDVMNDLLEVEVCQSLYVPAMFTIRLYSSELKWFDSTNFDVGKEVVISMGQDNNPAQVFKGEITGIELDSAPRGIPTITIRGFDKLHRLHRGRKTRSFSQVTDSDLVSSLAGEASLTAQADSTTEVYDYILQNNETNYEFLQRRADRIGKEIYCDESKLCFRDKPSAATFPTVSWGKDLTQFVARMSTGDQVDTVMVRGWNPKTKEAIVGQVTSSENYPVIGLGKSGKTTSSTFGAAKVAAVYRPVTSQAEAEDIAQAIFDELEGRFIQVEGECLGNSDIKAGQWLQVKEVGTRYSGKYYITACTHRYNYDGYYTSFEANGRQTNSVLEVSSMAAQRGNQRFYGTVIGVVTNNKDDEGKQNRVKVKFPWLPQNEGKDIESTWARIVTPMTGNGYGQLFLPEINDEVLVAFENGDIDRPYVLGGLWNGVDAPPKQSTDIVAGDGKVKERLFKTRSGHIVTFDDSDDAPKITIVDKTGNNKITIDSQANKITIESDADMDLKASKGKITLDAQNIEIKSSQDTKINAINVKVTASADAKIEATNNAEIKGTAGAKLQGAMVDIKGDATAKIDGGGLTEIKGGLIKLN
ncbi:MAG TPA: VgrG-related protein [Chloroflexia bacterium]|nr:VgrG-related protein [Chloroflexia bacterium]